MPERRLHLRAATADLELPRRDARLEITELEPRSRFVLRGAASFVASCSDLAGLDLAQPINRAVSSGSRAALRLGPDEWWLSVPVEEADELRRRFAEVAGAYALVDVSHRSAGLRLAGSAVVDLLSSGCPQSLSLTGFPRDRCTRTVFAQAEIVLWRRHELAFQLDVGRSFAPYVIGLLRQELAAS